MPYKDAKYRHIRRRHPDEIDDDTWSTVPISHTKARGNYPKGTLARVGKSKKTGNNVIQSILIPKE